MNAELRSVKTNAEQALADAYVAAKSALPGDGKILKLRDAAANSKGSLTLIVQADKAASEEHLVHLAMLARTAGINEMLFATLPRAAGSPANPKP